MVTRIVKLTLATEFIPSFIANFYEVQPFILKMKGCNGVQLQRDAQNPCVFFTISLWNTETDLNNYRETPLFRTTWARIKPHFTVRAEAWSTVGVIL